MNTRFILHTKKNYKSLHNNADFNFAKSHALRLYRANSIYTFIPKNACSSLRVSLAFYNGAIESLEDYNWIHSNNQTFSAELADLATANYTFVVLRCPYRRLVSAFLDKIVSREVDAWQLRNTVNREIDIENFTFSQFVRLLQKKPNRRSNIHWREQCEFLVYKKYDDYFSLENFNKCVDVLKDKIQLQVIDARGLTKHGSDQYEILDESQDFSEVTAFDLLLLKSQGKYPHPKSLFTNELITLVNQLYKNDIELYSRNFGVKDLLFS